MAKEKCFLCKEELKTGFMDKIVGTTIKLKKQSFFICSDCQKKHKENLKKELEK